jgi:hypothetical protein
MIPLSVLENSRILHKGLLKLHGNRKNLLLLARKHFSAREAAKTLSIILLSIARRIQAKRVIF